MAVLFIFFLRDPGQMWFAFLHVPHLIRGLIGFKINKTMPRSYEIVEKLKPVEGQEFYDGDTQITFEGYEAQMQTVILTTISETYEALQSKFKLYFWMTAICFALDIVDLIIQG